MRAETYAILILVLFVLIFSIPYVAVSVLIILGTIYLVKNLRNVNLSPTSSSPTSSSFSLTEIEKENLREFLIYKHRYIRSEKWRHKRIERKKLDDFQCVDCGTTDNLEVHHLSYRNLGIEPLSDLATVCRSCHQARHNRLGEFKTLNDYTNFKDK